MAYDSASDTALAAQAYQRALAAAQQQRSRLNQSFGLNADGSLDNSTAGHLGSIYQGNLQSVRADESAETVDRRRGFGGTGGLAGKSQAAAEENGQIQQAVNLRNASLQLGDVTQQEQFAGQDYQNQLGVIGSKSAYDLAQTLAANPVTAPAATAQQANGGIPPALAAARTAALKKNPRAAQVAKNNRY